MLDGLQPASPPFRVPIRVGTDVSRTPVRLELKWHFPVGIQKPLPYTPWVKIFWRRVRAVDHAPPVSLTAARWSAFPSARTLAMRRASQLGS